MTPSGLSPALRLGLCQLLVLLLSGTAHSTPASVQTDGLMVASDCLMLLALHCAGLQVGLVRGQLQSGHDGIPACWQGASWEAGVLRAVWPPCRPSGALEGADGA
ncbi:hypothetical protein HaLaN_00970, partial [Haematococcus lacustris]